MPPGSPEPIPPLLKNSGTIRNPSQGTQQKQVGPGVLEAQGRPFPAAAEGEREAHREIVQPPGQIPERARRIGEDPAAPEPGQAIFEQRQALLHRRLKARPELEHAPDQGVFLPDDQLGGGRRRGGAQVGDEVGDRIVGLVAHGRDDRRPGGRDRARHGFLVEGPEILQRAAAPRHNDHVEPGDPVQHLKGLHDLAGRFFSLHSHGRNQDVEVCEAACEDVQDVADRRAGRRRDEADLLGEDRQRPLAPGIEEPLPTEPILELLEGELEGSDPLRLEDLNDELVLAPRGVDVEGAEGEDLEAIRRLEPEVAEARAEEHRLELRGLVLHGEIDVARGRAPEVTDLAFDPEPGEGTFQLLFDPPRQLGDGQDPAVGFGEGKLHDYYLSGG